MVSQLATWILIGLQLPAGRTGCAPSDSLTVRNAHGMTFDSGSNETLLFGGADERKVLGDLWSWDGSTWRCLATEGPSPRTFPAFAYDTSRESAVLFGGNSVLFGTDADTATFLDDTWLWDGRAWKQIRTPGPSPRAEAAVAYDAKRRRVVLFGGYRNEGGDHVRLGDTWEWDGDHWTEMSVAGPSARNGVGMAYDAHRERVVLFGGSGGARDTWEWDGISWTHVASADTVGRFNSAMAYDSKARVVIRFGGWTRSGRVGDTWSFDGSRWTALTDDGPAPRNHTKLVFDPVRERMVLFGGHDGDHVFGDTWEWDGTSWINRGGLPPRLRIDNGH